MVEAAPAAALVVPKPEFLLELLVIAFDAPPELGEFDQARETNVLRQGREPVLGGFLLAFRPLDQEPFLRARFAQPVVAMSGSHPHRCEARGEPIGCALAPSDLSPRRLLKRQRRHRGRLVLAIPAHQRGRPSPARPRLGRQRCGPLRPNRGPLRPSRGPLRPNRGPLRPNRGPLRPNRGPLRPNRGPLRPNRGPLRPNRGPLRPNRGPLRPNRGP